MAALRETDVLLAETSSGARSAPDASCPAFDTARMLDARRPAGGSRTDPGGIRSARLDPAMETS